MEQNYKTVSELLFPENAAPNLSASQKFDEELRFRYRCMNGVQSIYNELDLQDDYQNIANFMKKHVFSVGKLQAVKDFQCGLNFLHKGIEVALEEDGDFGEKTFKAFYQVFKHYDINVLKNAIRKGAISNAVIGTASNKNIDTKKLVLQVKCNLGEIFNG